MHTTNDAQTTVKPSIEERIRALVELLLGADAEGGECDANT